MFLNYILILNGEGYIGCLTKKIPPEPPLTLINGFDVRDV
jgi:hypothetical protein